MKQLLILMSMLAFLKGYSQEKFTISGTVKSKKTGETIIGATVRSGNAGTTSNEYGFFSLTLVQGKHLLEVSAVGLAFYTGI